MCSGSRVRSAAARGRQSTGGDEADRHQPPGRDRGARSCLLRSCAREAEFEALLLAGDNLRVEMKRIDTSRRGEIEALDPASYDHVLVLGYSDHMGAQPAD